MDVPFFVYILASKRNGTLYVGVTNHLARRLSEHKAKLVPGFTRKTRSTNSFILKRSIPSLTLARGSKL
jgi:predicted GIY-YIG superfamily endonuclease